MRWCLQRHPTTLRSEMQMPMQMEMEMAIDSFMQIYQSLNWCQRVKDVARLLVIKRSAEGLTFQFATRRDRMANRMVEKKNSIQDMQICKSTRWQFSAKSNMQLRQEFHCSLFSLCFSVLCSSLLTNFVNLYLPRAAHTNNPRNRLKQQREAITKSYCNPGQNPAPVAGPVPCSCSCACSLS